MTLTMIKDNNVFSLFIVYIYLERMVLQNSIECKNKLTENLRVRNHVEVVRQLVDNFFINKNERIVITRKVR